MTGANDDDDYISDREEAAIKFSFPDRKSVEKTSDEELLVIISKGITCLPLCRRTSCDCLGILLDVNVRECVAQYLLQFVNKSKYDQDSIILKWYKYAIAARIASLSLTHNPFHFFFGFCHACTAGLHTEYVA